MQGEKQHIRKSLLGQGTFGKVFKCLNTKTSKNQAIKVIENVSLMNVESLENEAQAMMAAKSDNAVSLINHYYDESEQSYIFVMPYYKKGSLVRLMDQQWTRQDILCFLYQICHAFLSIQQAFCWHLDLKPDNILIKNNGQYLVCDFGCAKLVDGDMQVSRFMALSMGYGKGMGTTLYAAPEIINDMKGGNYSDVWSLGVILYYILYKKHPIEKKGNTASNYSYSSQIKKFTDGKLKISFPQKPGFEECIHICKEMLQPKSRISWADLRKTIYQILKLPQKTPIICSIDNFIQYAHDVERIVLGLVSYLNGLPRNHLNDLQIYSATQKVIKTSKAYIWLLFDKVQEALLGDTTKGYVQFYLFEITKANIKAQQIQKIEYLSTKAKQYTKQEYQKINDPSLISMEMVLNQQIKAFLEVARQNYQKWEKPRPKSYWQAQGFKINPIYQFDKIFDICEFIVTNKGKTTGLNFADKDQITDFARKVVYS